MRVRSLGWKNSLEEGMTPHSSIFAWRNPWTEDPGRSQSIGSRGVRYNCSVLACAQASGSIADSLGVILHQASLLPAISIQITLEMYLTSTYLSPCSKCHCDFCGLVKQPLFCSLHFPFLPIPSSRTPRSQSYLCQKQISNHVSTRTSLAVQWLRLHLPNQGVQVLTREVRSHMPHG